MPVDPVMARTLPKRTSSRNGAITGTDTTFGGRPGPRASRPPLPAGECRGSAQRQRAGDIGPGAHAAIHQHGGAAADLHHDGGQRIDLAAALGIRLGYEIRREFAPLHRRVMAPHPWVVLRQAPLAHRERRFLVVNRPTLWVRCRRAFHPRFEMFPAGEQVNVQHF
jgi:hypothetical protein